MSKGTSHRDRKPSAVSGSGSRGGPLETPQRTVCRAALRPASGTEDRSLTVGLTAQRGHVPPIHCSPGPLAVPDSAE